MINHQQDNKDAQLFKGKLTEILALKMKQSMNKDLQPVTEQLGSVIERDNNQPSVIQSRNLLMPR